MSGADTKEVEQQRESELARWSSPHPDGPATLSESEHMTEEKAKQADLYQSLLRSVASSNITTLQAGLAKQTKYWSGVAWVAAALGQRLEGVAAGAIDLNLVTAKLNSFVTLGDAGLLRKSI